MGIQSVEMFPSALRKTNDSKFTSERNITGIIRAVTDNDSYIIKLDNTQGIEFVVHGYYFNLSQKSLSELGNNCVASIRLDSSYRLVSYSNGSTTLDDNSGFNGLYLGSSPTTGPGYYSLQLTDSSGNPVKESFLKLDSKSVTTTDTIESGSNLPISSDAVNSLKTDLENSISNINNTIDGLDVSDIGGTGKYITTISQSNGKISAVAGNTATTNTGNTLVLRDSNGNFSAGTITANLTGTASVASKLNSDAGSASQPVYFSNGVPVSCTSIGLNSATATKATQDESGNNIKASYASSISISDHTITLLNKNGASLGNVTVPDNNTTYSASTGLNLSGTTFSLKQASTSEIGGIKTGYTQSGKNYPVALNSSGQAYVNVPWTDTNTTYSFSNKNVTLSWGTKSTIATVGGTDITVTMPGNPNTDTNTWRPVANNLTTTDGNYSLAAPQGKWLNENKISIGGATSNVALTSKVVRNIIIQSSQPSGSTGDIWIKI